MAKKKRIRKFLGSIYNVKAWIGYNQIRQGLDVLRQVTAVATNIKLPTNPYQEEVFAEALARLNLSQQEVAQIQQGYFRNFLLYLMVGIILAICSIYRFYLGHWIAGWITMMLMIMLFCASLLSHFWYFKIKNRKLNCTVKEWYYNKVFN